MYKSTKQKNITMIVFGIYMLLLAWLVLFKLRINISELGHMRNVNLIPFKGSMIINGKISLKEIIYNIMVFVPLGTYIGIIKNEWSIVKKILPCLLITLIFETIQYVFAIGASDITDVIGNTLGGFLGILLCMILKKIAKDKHITVVNVICIIIEILAFGLLTLLFLANR